MPSTCARRSNRLNWGRAAPARHSHTVFFGTPKRPSSAAPLPTQSRCVARFTASRTCSGRKPASGLGGVALSSPTNVAHTTCCWSASSSTTAALTASPVGVGEAPSHSPQRPHRLGRSLSWRRRRHKRRARDLHGSGFGHHLNSVSYGLIAPEYSGDSGPISTTCSCCVAHWTRIKARTLRAPLKSAGRPRLWLRVQAPTTLGTPTSVHLTTRAIEGFTQHWGTLRVGQSVRRSIARRSLRTLSSMNPSSMPSVFAPPGTTVQARCHECRRGVGTGALRIGHGYCPFVDPMSQRGVAREGA
jgi:hypothetical protein